MSRYNSPTHRRAREAWLPVVEAGLATCWRCRLPIPPDAPWDLGHGDGAHRDEYRGPEHVHCNRRTSSHKAARRKRTPEPHPGSI